MRAISLGALCNTLVGGIGSAIVRSSTTQTLSTASNIRLLAFAEACGDRGAVAAGLSRTRNSVSGIGLSSGESGEAKRDDNSRELHFD